MRRFFTKLGVFTIIGVILLLLICAAMLNDTVFRIMNRNRVGTEVYFALRRSRRPGEARIIVLGDSVGGQIFNDKNETAGRRHLCTNQAISMVG